MSSVTTNFIATRCDELLGQINCEYRSKRSTGRLGAIKCTNAQMQDFAWETQFKFLPLIRLKSC